MLMSALVVPSLEYSSLLRSHIFGSFQSFPSHFLDPRLAVMPRVFGAILPFRAPSALWFFLHQK